MEKEVTIYDLAKKLGLSPATVSRALQNNPAISEKTRKRIQKLAERTGYRSNPFARNLRNQQSHTLGVIVPRLDSYFMGTVIAGMEDAAGASGFKLIISQSSESAVKEAAGVKALFDSRVDGLLTSLAFDTDSADHFRLFTQKKIPVVFFDRVPDTPEGARVLIDNQAAAYQLTRHLLQQGCRHLAHITGMGNRNVYAARLAGFAQALTEAGLPFSEAQVIRGQLRQEDGIAAAAALLQWSRLPDGVFVANDQCAAACLAALKKRGIRIPYDMAIAGFNNDPVCTVVEPNLTTVGYPGYQMGHIAATRLIETIQQPACATQEPILLEAPLLIRASSVRQQQP